MTDAQRLANELNALTKSTQFSYVKARACARGDDRINREATRALNEDFNPDVDGCESFAMKDGSRCEWSSGQFRYRAVGP
jgi:hypothetical protein